MNRRMDSRIARRVLVLISMVLALLSFRYSTLPLIWPTSDSPTVTASYSSYEVVDGVGKQHRALDIYGQPNVTKMISPGNGSIHRVVIPAFDPKLPLDTQEQAITIVIKIPPDIYVLYSHCEELAPQDPDFVDLYSGTYPYSIPIEGTAIRQGQAFATVATAEKAQTTFPHVHFQYKIGDWELPSFNVNALEYFAPENRDPENNPPRIGPLFIKQTMNNVYQKFDKLPFLFSKVDIIREITDNMGHDIFANENGEIADDDVWFGPPYRFAGITSSPHRVKFSIKNADDRIIVPEEEITFTGPPLSDDLISLVYEADKPSRQGPDYSYCFNLTNISTSGFAVDKYWNTRLKKEEAWDGVDALLYQDAEFPDGKYKLYVAAEDLSGRPPVEDLQMVTIDNFRPFVKKVTIANNSSTPNSVTKLYEAEWTLATGVLNYGLQPTPNGNIQQAASPSKNVDIIIEFSEPMEDAKITEIEPSLDALPTLTSDQPELERTIWKGTLSQQLLFSKPLPSSQLILTIDGRDLAGNGILKIRDTTPIDPVMKLTRDPKDPNKMQGEAGTDKLHRFNIAQDVTLLVDVTASMINGMSAVKAGLQRLVNEFDASGIRTEYNLFWFFAANSSFFFPKALNVQDKNSMRDAILTTNAQSGVDPSCTAQSLRACAILLPQNMPHGGTTYVFTDSPPVEGMDSLKKTIREMRKLGIKIQSLLPAPEDCGTAAALASREQGQSNAGLWRETPNLKSNRTELLAQSRQAASGTLTAYDAFSRLSGETGGQFFLVDIPDVPAAFNVLIADELLDSQLLVRETSGAQVYSAPVDTSVREVSFLLKEKPDAKVNLVVRRPDGALLAVSDPDVSFSSGSNFEFYRVSGPAEGNWSAEISGNGDFSFEVAGDTPLKLSLLSTPDWIVGEQQFIRVVLSGEQNIASASFNLVTLDGSAVTPLSLFDDGGHNDFGAGDGIYGGAFTPATVDTFRIQATGTTASGENFVRQDRIPIIIGADPNTSVVFDEPSPKTFALYQNYPNPFWSEATSRFAGNPETKIGFDIPDLHKGKVTVRLAIYNISGQLVRLLLDEQRVRGRHEILWDGRDAFGKAVSAGVYFYQITAGGFKARNKMLVLK